jgi:uncharacterized protein (DUF58 family)
MIDKLLPSFQHIRRLHLKTLRNVDNFFAGMYRSSFKGKGIEFEEVREYQVGDDIRQIDWNVTARSSSTFVKNFQEERELTVLLIVDISLSSRFSHTPHLKSELIAEIAALLAFSAIKNQDKVGLVLFSDQIELYIKPSKGTRHVLRVIREILYFKTSRRGTDIQQALAFVGKVQRRHAICFLISDFLSVNFARQATLLAKRHELFAFQVYDTYEQGKLPPALFTFRDLETNFEKVVDTANPLVMQQFIQKAQVRQQTLVELFKKIGVFFLSFHTEETSLHALQRFFKMRARIK